MGDQDRLLVSHLLLRQFLGWMAISLPFLLVVLKWIFFGWGIESSISAYYHITYVGAVFVGFLFAIGVFLLAYIGYKPQAAEKISDNIVANFAGVFALGVAFFPTPPANPSEVDGIFGIVHFASAGLLFAALAYFAFFLFTKTHPDAATRTISDAERRKKDQRNLVYRISGIVISLCIVLLVVNYLIGDALRAINPVFWLEAIAVVAFGIAWIVKGEALLGGPKVINPGSSTGDPDSSSS